MLEAELVEFQPGDAMIALGKVLAAFEKELLQQGRIIGE